MAVWKVYVRVVSLDTIEETPDDVQTITGITKLNNFEFSSVGSIYCWRAYSVGQGKVIKIEKSSSGELMVLEWAQAFLLVYDSLFCKVSINKGKIYPQCIIKDFP